MAAFLIAPRSSAFALNRQALQQIAARYVNQPVVLKGDLRAGSPGPEGMQAPMLDAKGWHFMAGPAVLHLGSHAEITGVFNYAERGLFLEIASVPEDPTDPLLDRPRLRVRIMTDVPATNPSGQTAQASALIDQIVARTQP